MPASRAPTHPYARDDLSEEEIAAGFVDGDQECVAAVYRRFGTLVHTLATRSLRDAGDAEDVTQQVFLAAWHGRRNFRPERGTLTGWIVGITRNKVADALSACARRAQAADAAGQWIAGVPRPHHQPEEMLEVILVA